MDKIITTNTSVFHISDAFYDTNNYIFVEDNFEELSKYYRSNKSIYLKDKSKIYQNLFMKMKHQLFINWKLGEVWKFLRL